MFTNGIFKTVFFTTEARRTQRKNFFEFGQDLLDFTGYFIFYFQNFPDESDEE